ncbi:hypothetical protein [Crocinitomix algicola]|uniref:hypothetical protein n=1 Tax=Crocinitomix algicola TaxID=1740263 RepID=UPI0008377417|nr:hypothetical protein [Crocinitomix algicola]
MSDFTEVLESNEPSQQNVPEVVKVLAIFSYIGNGFWILAFLVIYMMMRMNSNELAALMNINMASDYFVNIFLIVFILASILGGLCIYGAALMSKGLKKGFTFYAIGNGIWVLILLIGSLENGPLSNYIILLISAVFILVFGMQLKHLR